jgi:DNA polymerase III epsilon subunit-like protein
VLKPCYEHGAIHAALAAIGLPHVLLRPCLTGRDAGRLKLVRPLVAFDLETTGLDTKRDRIVEFAAVRKNHSVLQDNICQTSYSYLWLSDGSSCYHMDAL